jgi:hypothetical protein
MKSFKQFLKEEIEKKEKQAQNIVGAERKQKEKEAVEQDDEGMTPGTETPTGGEQPAEQQVVTGAPAPEEKKEEPDPIIDIIMQQLKDRKDKLAQQNQQEFLVRQQEYDNFMKEIEDVIAKNQPQ